MGRAELPYSALSSHFAEAVLISQAHVDHCGRLNMLVREGFSSHIYCSEPTKELLPVMLGMAFRYGDYGVEQFM